MSLSGPKRETSWYRQLGRRLKAHWRFKLIAVASIVAVFFAFYFLLLHYPVFRVRIVPNTMLDRVISFQPFALWLYASLFLYIALPSALLDNKRHLVVCLVVVSGLCLAGLLAFFLWPTGTPPKYLAPADHPVFAPLVAMDKPRNACPSMHAAFAVFTAIFIHWMASQLGRPHLVRWVSWLWCAGILYSTLATKQHVAIDLYTGSGLGAIWALVYLRFFPPRGSKQLTAKS